MQATDKPKFIHPQTLHAYVDGSCRDGGNASCAYVIFSEKTQHIVKISRWAFRNSTNNQGELQGINKALDCPNSDYLIIYSDSTYCISALTLWYKTWEKNNWKTPLGELVKNKDLIVEILEKIKRKKFVRFVKVRAHRGDPFNSMADYLAQRLTWQMVNDPNLPEGEYPL